VPSAVPASENIVVMGRILAPHGVRGWIKVQPVSEAPEALLEHATWRVRAPRASSWLEMRRLAGRMHSGTLLVSLAGVSNREEAMALRGADVGVLRSTLPRNKKNEIYWVDLEGLAVVNREGVALGVVAEVVAHGAHPLLRVARPGGERGQSGPDRLIPYVPAVVDRVDLAGRRIDVDWREDF
jgi:16S rRNA processing protein RimM